MAQLATGKAETPATPTIPLKTQFEQLQSSEQGLTSEKARIVAIGILLPYTPLAGPLGFTPLPGLYFLFLIAMTVTYLLLVELVKRPLMKRYAQ